MFVAEAASGKLKMQKEEQPTSVKDKAPGPAKWYHIKHSDKERAKKKAAAAAPSRNNGQDKEH